MTDQQSKAEIFAKLPADIQAFLKQKATPAIAIDVTRAKQPLGLTSSKFGGVPYIAPDADCPRDEKGYPYQLLAQFNFADIAEQAGQHPDLPATGLLQIFIPCCTDGNCGILDDEQQTRFFPNIPDANQVNTTVIAELQEWNNDLATLDFVPWNDKEQEEQRKAAKAAFAKKYDGAMPELGFYVECALRFSIEVVYPDCEDEVDGHYFSSFHDDDDIRRLYTRFIRRKRGRQYLLGYPPYFTHGDQRIYIFHDKPVPEALKAYQIDEFGTVLRNDWRHFLFFDSVREAPKHDLINWIDAQFLISEEHLQECNFSELIGYSNAT